MKTAVWYFSRTGNTKLAAEAIARGAGCAAVPVTDEHAALTEPVDVLFVGGALYAYGLDRRLKEWIAALDGRLVGRAVVFSTSWISRHSVDLIKVALAARGISVETDYFYAKNRPDENKQKDAEAFGRRYGA